MSLGRNVPRDKTSQGTKRLKTLIEIFFYFYKTIIRQKLVSHSINFSYCIFIEFTRGTLLYFLYLSFERVPLAIQFVKVHYYFINCNIHIYIITRQNIYEKQRQKAKLLHEKLKLKRKKM